MICIHLIIIVLKNSLVSFLLPPNNFANKIFFTIILIRNDNGRIYRPIFTQDRSKNCPHPLFFLILILQQCYYLNVHNLQIFIITLSILLIYLLSFNSVKNIHRNATRDQIIYKHREERVIKLRNYYYFIIIVITRSRAILVWA